MPATRAQQLVARIDGRRIARFRLVIDELRPLKQRAGWWWISVGLAHPNGRRIGGPVMSGIVSGGGRGVAPWIECRLYPAIQMKDGQLFDTRTAGVEQRVIRIFGRIIPSGGHLMIDYESAGQEESQAELRMRVPPAATALGAAMVRAGFVGEFKDWYFSEGGHEGPRKLQGNKPPDARFERAAIAHRIEELGAFMQQPPPSDGEAAEIVARARQRASALLRELCVVRRARSRKSS